MTTAEPYTIGVDALNEHWKAEAFAADVVGWIFAALDAAGDTTVLRDDRARADAITMANMVFVDLGDEQDNGAMVSNVLRVCVANPAREVCFLCFGTRRCCPDCQEPFCTNGVPCWQCDATGEVLAGTSMRENDEPAPATVARED